MKNIDQIIEETVAAAKDSEASVQEAVNMILGANGVTAGSTVAIINDPTFPCDGLTGKVKGPSSKGSGFMSVELPNGTVVDLQASLLIPV